MTAEPPDVTRHEFFSNHRVCFSSNRRGGSRKMKRTVVGAIAVVTVAAVATMTGFGLASAASALPASPGAAPITSNAQYLQNQAAVVQVLHDQLKAAALNGDVAGSQDAVNKITTELGQLATPQGRA